MPLEHGGGTEKYLLETATQLKRLDKNLEISIITPNEKLIKKILFFYSFYFQKNLSSSFLREQEKTIQKKLGPVTYQKMESLERLSNELKKFDVIYSTNNLLEVVLLSLFFRNRSRPKIILGFHIPMTYLKTNSIQSLLHNILYNSFIYKNLINQANILHVINNFDEKRLSKLLSYKKIVKIYNPFDFDDYQQMAHHKKYSEKWQNNKINILWVGRLTEQKGIDDLLFLIQKINHTDLKNKIIWNIVGDGELKPKVVEIANQFNNVRYFGYIQQYYLPSIYKNNQLYISTSKWESFPYNLLEAQCFGLPVICYNIHGCNDIIDHEKNGFLVETKQEFLSTLIQVIKHNKKPSTDIKKYIRSKFNYHLLYEKLHILFTK